MKVVVLAKDWGPHKAGETIEVDEERARQLFADGYASTATVGRRVPDDPSDDAAHYLARGKKKA